MKCLGHHPHDSHPQVEIVNDILAPSLVSLQDLALGQAVTQSTKSHKVVLFLRNQMLQQSCERFHCHRNLKKL